MFQHPSIFLIFLLTAVLAFMLPVNSLAQPRYIAPRAVVNDGPTQPNFDFLSNKLWEADDFCWENDLNTEVGFLLTLE
jgi:hypothetical protein